MYAQPYVTTFYHETKEPPEKQIVIQNKGPAFLHHLPLGLSPETATYTCLD